MAFVAGGGVQGFLDTLAPRLNLGVRLDLPWATLAFTVLGHSATTSPTDYFDRTDQGLGGEIGLYRSIDIGPFTVAPGAAVGAEAYIQSFSGDLVMDDRVSALGWASPRLRAGLALGPRLFLDLEGGMDAVVGSYVEDGTSSLGAEIRPFVRLGVGVWLFRCCCSPVTAWSTMPTWARRCFASRVGST